MTPVELTTPPSAKVAFADYETVASRPIQDEDQPRCERGVSFPDDDDDDHDHDHDASVGASPPRDSLVLVPRTASLTRRRLDDEETTASKTFLASIASVDASGSPIVSVLLHESRPETSTSAAIKDPIEGRDSEFDVELSCSSSIHSLSINALDDESGDDESGDEKRRDEKRGASEEDDSASEYEGLGDHEKEYSIVYGEDESHLASSTSLSDSRQSTSSAPPLRGTIYGKVVKSLQRSIKKIFHHGKAGRMAEPSTSLAATNDCFAPTATGPCASDVPVKAITYSPSPITSVDPGAPSSSLSPLHKTLLIDVSYSKPLLSLPRECDIGKKCLVLDLDETLVHSTFQPVSNADLIVPVHLGEGVFQPIYVCKRPGVDAFLAQVSVHFEVVLFTASLSNYADPVIDFLDPHGGIRFRLYREDCLQFQGIYIKDLSRLGRELDQVLIVDNSPASFSMHPQNALGCRSWFKDPHDTELNDRILPMLMRLKDAPSVSRWRQENLELIETPYNSLMIPT